MDEAKMEQVSREQRFSDSLYTQKTEVDRTSKRFMREMVPSDRPLKVLDVGCGTGMNARFLRDMGHSVVGIDLSPVAVEKLREAGFEGHVCDVPQGLPFEDAAFDFIYASEVIEHVSDTEGFLAELARVLRPGGELLLSTPNSAFWPFRILGALGRTATELQHPGHIRFFSKQSLTRAIQIAGFDQVSVSARHMYLVLPDAVGKRLAPLLRLIGLRREYRMRTDSYFWHIDRRADRASRFWADTLIVKAVRGG